MKIEKFSELNVGDLLMFDYELVRSPVLIIKVEFSDYYVFIKHWGEGDVQSYSIEANSTFRENYEFVKVIYRKGNVIYKR